MKIFFGKSSIISFFESLFQQLIYLLFLSLGTVIYQDYGRGDVIGQWGYKISHMKLIEEDR